MNKYVLHKKQVVSETSNAKIVHCSLRDQKHKYVCKLINPTRGSMKIQREIEIQKHLSDCNANIVKVVDSWYDPVSLLNGIIMDFYDYGTVSNCYFFESDVKRQVFNILESLSTIHDAGIIHGDIKEKNIMLDGGDKLLFIDFGISYHYDEEVKKRPISGTPLYMAPEVWRCEMSNASDIWSVGVVAYRLLHHGNYPFIHLDRDVLCGMILNNLPGINDLTLSKNAVHFLKGCLRKDPKERLTMQECLNHPWFDDAKEKPL